MRKDKELKMKIFEVAADGDLKFYSPSKYKEQFEKTVKEIDKWRLKDNNIDIMTMNTVVITTDRCAGVPFAGADTVLIIVYYYEHPPRDEEWGDL